MIIKALGPKDAPAISTIALASKATWGYDAAFMAACKDELTFHDKDFEKGLIKGAFDGEQLAGFYMLCADDEGKGDLYALFVAPEYIGKGVGKALIADCKMEARAKGFKSLMVESDPHAEDIYAHFGWVTVGRTPSHSIEGRTLPLMELAL